MPDPIIVLKFGSSVIPCESSLSAVVSEIARWIDRGYRVVAVVSAIGCTTDRLLAHAKAIAADAPAPLAAYVATGELQSVALLGLALADAGIPAAVRDSAAIGLTTDGPPLDARPTSLDAAAVRRVLADVRVLVLPGFLGRSAAGETTLLGRGGSDLSALVIAHRLNARCRLVKDVDGLYDRDPAEWGDAARRYDTASYHDVLGLSEGIIQHKAVRFAQDHALEFEVAALASDAATRISNGACHRSVVRG